MPRYIVKIGDRYGEWSSVVDAYVTLLMPRAAFESYYRDEYGRRAFESELPKRMERVEAKGTSCVFSESAEELMSLNRCGPGESILPVAQVIAEWERESDAASEGASPEEE